MTGKRRDAHGKATRKRGNDPVAQERPRAERPPGRPPAVVPGPVIGDPAPAMPGDQKQPSEARGPRGRCRAGRCPVAGGAFCGASADQRFTIAEYPR